MEVYGYASAGYEGILVKVEAALHRSIPGMDIVGLPDGAVRESRDRIRAAVSDSGFEFPRQRILINLAPAGVKKGGASFDLAITAALLGRSGQLIPLSRKVLLMGELELSGAVRPVSGVLAAASHARSRKIPIMIIPRENVEEARTVFSGQIAGIDHLEQLKKIMTCIYRDPKFGRGERASTDLPETEFSGPDFLEIRGLCGVKRSLEIAAAGKHNILLFGPPGGGKTLCATAVQGILPPYFSDEAVETSRIWSLAGKLGGGEGLLARRPFRSPHHTASVEGILGGGSSPLPGEVSLAHRGVLFLDEAAEFRGSLLQGLREPLAQKRISLVRAQKQIWYPADFQLIMTSNPCPCGNLGRKAGICTCTRAEIDRYWKKFGGALLDRIDMRIPVEPVEPEELFGDPGESTETIRRRTRSAADRQQIRVRGEDFNRNADIPPGKIRDYCPMTDRARERLQKAARKMGLSSRACHSAIKVARTIADLREEEILSAESILEAVQYRRFGDSHYFWKD